MSKREYFEFEKALPIWAEGRSRTPNTSIWIERKIEGSSNATLLITGANDYQIFVNGVFCHYGPARAGRGYYRVDEIELGNLLHSGINSLSILAGAYNVDNFCFFNEAGFVAAEVLRNGEIIAATGDGEWHIYDCPEKIVRTQRYSYQRVFAEAYDFIKADKKSKLSVEVSQPRTYIKREVPYPIYERETVTSFTRRGRVIKSENPDYYKDRAIDDVGNGDICGFTKSELDVCTVWKTDELVRTPSAVINEPLPAAVTAGNYLGSALSGELTGFIELKIKCKRDAEIHFIFDEIISDDSIIDYRRMRCSNSINYKLSGNNEYRLITAQPYSFMHFDIICVSGEIKIDYVGLIRLDFNPSLINKGVSDGAPKNIKKIFDAAVSTFRQNTVDIYMDCPSRERAGWLCDSFFTARVERLLTGQSLVEHAFLDNFTMEERYYNNLPKGMLPMCYPSEHASGIYIANWAMWYFLEVKEYLERTSDAEFVMSLKNKAYELLEYFKAFENSDGLIERMESWVFVEWSRSNSLTQDINYPSNMLYYAFLNTLAELYKDNSLAEKARKLRETIRAAARNGLFFCDNSVYRDGIACLSGESTESCQYYAFFTGVATPEEDGELWQCLVEKFGPKRRKTGFYPEVAPSNAFIGNYLRCELLMKYNLADNLIEDIDGYFIYMAEKTHTLWENDTVTASCNHGFASHVLIWLDYLGYLTDKT